MELSEFQAAVATVRRGCAGGVELAAERARAEAALSNSAAVAAKLQASAERYAHLYQEFIKLKERFAKQGKELSQLKEVRRLLATLSPGPHVAGAEPPRALAPVSLASTKPCNPDPAPAPSSARRQRKPGNRPTVVLHAEHGRGADAELELTQPVDAPIPQREPDAVAPPQQPSPGHLSQAGGSKHTMPKAQGGELQRRPCAPRSPTPTPQSPGAAGADRKAPSLVRAMEAGRWPFDTPVFTGRGSQAKRDEYARAHGHRFMVAYQVFGGDRGNHYCYLSFHDAQTFCKLYYQLLVGVYCDSSNRSMASAEDVCFFEQLYLPCHWCSHLQCPLQIMLARGPGSFVQI
jgi:hypothetical protein